ncbi:MAG: TrkH family potassium uptake protein [Peptoniphilus sp.]|nr:TrkH family potassium uptake protein [Peptoniphilus sp.]MDD7363839.1 TrkH family potassium uptake protein [Bacillota bacterium]MDY6044322.1 TrkH family potassium uptake protein [Peptoniphilus sp.]
MKLPDSLYKRITKNPSFVVLISFLILILTGTALLSLPLASADGQSAGFIDALFTSTSASCVTGLIVRNTATGWSSFGKIIILLLIQIGGLGTMTMVAWVSILSDKRIGLSGRIFIKTQLNADSLAGLVKLLRFATLFTLSAEASGALLLSFHLIPMYGFRRGAIFSIFHAISAFCNAGFDLFGDSLVSFQANYYVTIIIALLIILGGLGFIVYVDLWRFPEKRRLSAHTKLVIWTTLLLLAGGAILFFVFERHNPETIGSLPLSQQILASFFQSVTFRTAGYNSVNMAGLKDTMLFVSVLLMFIGGSPGSTAGGIKTTTFAIVVCSCVSSLRGVKDTVLFKRRISEETKMKAFELFIIAILLVFSVSLLIVIFEKEAFDFVDILFETVSAFGTVGVSSGITGFLSTASKIVLSMLMYIGRIGPATFAMGMFLKEHSKKYRFSEGKFIVG